MRKICIAVSILIVAIGAAIGWCWSVRTTPDMERAERKAVATENKACAASEAVAFIEKLMTEKFSRVRFGTDFPWLKFTKETRVSHDFIAQMLEDQIIRFSGDGKTKQTDKELITKLLAVSEKLRPLCSKPGRDSLDERRLDGCFLIGDYDAAIKLLDSGVTPGAITNGTTAIVAKLRAHKALEKGDNETAVKHFLTFVDFMLSDDQKDFEQCDPTTGLLYSREWVVAFNYARCAKLSPARADEFRKLSAKYYAIALKKAETDKDDKAVKAIKDEMKEAGL